jgi:hypothetical protein
MRAIYLFFLALIAAGITHAADATPLRSLQWAHTTRAYCASVAPAPCAPSLIVVIYSSVPDLGYRVKITYKHSDSSRPVDTLILFADRVQKGSVRNGVYGFQGAILGYDPCLLDSGDISVQEIEATPVAANGPAFKEPESNRIKLQ